MKNNRKIALALATMLAIALTSAAGAADDKKPTVPSASHKQTKIISIPVGEEKVKIHTFCVDPKGRLLCSCGGEQMVTKRTPDGFQAEVIKSSPGIRVVSPREVKDQLRRIRVEGLGGETAIRALAARLGVDYVIWGSLDTTGETVQAEIYRRNDGQKIVAVTLASQRDDLAYDLMEAAVKNLVPGIDADCGNHRDRSC